MSKDKKKNKDVFDEALELAISESINEDIDVTVESTLEEQALVVTKENSDEWVELKKAIEGKHTKRFNDVLNDLPDREFVRAYLKSLEYFKPKTTRQDASAQSNGDTNITINVIKTTKVIKAGEETIDVTNVEIDNLNQYNEH